ncbi:50S ribosomal protein L5 [Candidatus Cytomitobacter primus]|uniref:Large ribosomal subunit protein uL5 n=1 Tax=Candidatus Cytomitobacter primus TaxID=2066024 RepID=A0A5C0UG03_9PROT|nr:50S ribosomal protein L5 [Candidatus Cytomitobacter primus]QEK38729.1 50S ribosomal protein L5 [Candidatus Cytomitobacter primus]
MNRLSNLFKKSIASEVQTKLSLSNPFAVPKLSKIVVSAGCGKYLKEQNKIDFVFEQIMKITGQLPVRAIAKKSVAGFSVREGMVSGVHVTLRKDAMYNFVDRLVYLALPRVRDFHGMSLNAFDGNGNYNLGIRDHTIFFESDDAFSFGLNIAIITSATTDKECKALLEGLLFPFRERVQNV